MTHSNRPKPWNDQKIQYYEKIGGQFNIEKTRG